jgi:hypothetical protein
VCSREEFYACKEDLKNRIVGDGKISIIIIIIVYIRETSNHGGKSETEKAHGERVEAKARRGVDEQRRRESRVSGQERRRGWAREV